MIQVDEKELAIVIGLAARAPKTAGEAYALQDIVNRWNAFKAMQQGSAAPPAGNVSGETKDTA